MNAQDSPEAKVNLAAIESKLAQLDGVFFEFCSRHEYRFSGSSNIFPNRRMWRRQEIDRVLDLELGTGFQDALDRGFYPDFPWSLYARGSLHPGTDPQVHILSRPIFEKVPHSQLASVLEDGLTSGLRIVKAMTASEILAHGETRAEMALKGQHEYENYRRGQESARKADRISPNGD